MYDCIPEDYTIFTRDEKRDFVQMKRYLNNFYQEWVSFEFGREGQTNGQTINITAASISGNKSLQSILFNLPYLYQALGISGLGFTFITQGR